jgi:hypothetical protein
MESTLKFTTIPFPIHQNVQFFPTKTVLELLNISPSTLERYRNSLIDLRCPGFEYQFYSKGYFRTSVISLWHYAQIVKQAGVVLADENISSYMKDIL